MRPPPRRALELGVAHVAGAYRPDDSRPFLQAGADDVRALGARTLKVYLTPDYATKYPQPWPEVHSLDALAATESFRALFAQPFDTFVLTTYSFASGTGDAWRARDDEALLEAEAAELEALTRHLRETYRGTGKRFVLQNWEGDWVLRAGDERAATRMIRWLGARQAGVTRGRRATTSDVEVEHAIEVNLVLRDEGPSMTREVLPFVCADSLSYSAWEALEVDAATSLQEQRARLGERLSEAIARLRAVNDAPIALGELGFAENEQPTGATSALLDETLQTARRLELTRAIYWQVYDNECTDAGCRGLWVVRPDGSRSEAARGLASFATTGTP